MKNIKQYLILFTGLQIFHFSILTYWIFNGISVIYGTNDDSLMSSISSGNLTGVNDEHLIFIEPIFSMIIKYLEILLPNFSGYTFFLIFVTTSSFVSILTTTLILKKINVFFLIFYVLSFTSLQSWFAINPTYTGASLFAAGAAAAHINLLIFLKNRDSKYLLAMIFSVFCFISYGIRNEGIFIALILSLPGLIFLVRYFKEFKKPAMLSVIVLLILYIFNAITSNFVYSPDWKSYLELNSLRHQIQLREPERRLENHLTEIEWKESTYFMFKKFNLTDEAQMNSNNMNRIIEVTKVGYLDEISLSRTFKDIKNEFNPWSWILKFLLLLIVSSLLINFISKDLFGFLFFYTVLSFSSITLLIILSNFYQLPERISFNLLSAIILTSLMTVKNVQINANKFLSVFLLFALILSGYDYFKRFSVELNARQNAYQTRIVYAQTQQEFFSKLESEVLISGASSLKSDWQNPYLKFKPIDARNKTLMLGWHNLSPIWFEQVQNLNLNEKDFYSNLLKPNVFWVDNPEEIANTQEFIEDHFGFNVTVAKVENIGNDEYFMYKFNE